MALRDYFSVRPPSPRPEIEAGLWTQIDEDHFGSAAQYQEALFRQYALYVEMADRVSQRRSNANTFFLTVNAGVLVVMAGRFERGFDVTIPIVVIAGVTMIVQCLVWFFILRSHRQLNAAKFAVIGAFEQRLPARVYGDAEWVAVGEGRDPRRYWPLTRIETLVPFVFAVAYLAAIVAVVLDL